MNCIQTFCSLDQGPLSGIFLTSDGESLQSLQFIIGSIEKERLLSQRNPRHSECELHRRAHEQLEEYINGRLRSFDLPIQLNGTEFQRKVWHIIEDIPHGQVLTYGQIAAKLGSPGLSRAVGQAANKNPIPLIIPCHRVVGAGGKLTGFASGVELKSYLLSHERRDRLW
ncbi:methylated-DNA--[protein]-cysteine S-methyltransferase [Desulfosediminicola sp.]|uniref:methylated-DNA--[protein]-cysteine S-methyltransferase n=1 Tax=Desulfosediminicola sp. TaxID=2886825 RepID=UPI003AF29F95